MSREHLELVRRVYAEWERGNMKAGVELFDPAIVFESFMPDTSERVVVHGPEEVEVFMREWLGQWRDYRLIGDEFREVGDDRVFVAGRQTATGRHSGVAVEDLISSLWTFRHGKVVHLLFERDKEAALEAAGIAEEAQSGQNAEAVRAGFEAFNSGDDDAWLALWHEDAELHELAEIPDADVYRGHDGIRAWIANVRNLLGEFRFEPRSVLERGDTVLAEVTASGTGAGSGVPVTWTAYIVLQVRDGKVARAQGFLDRDQALQAAGVAG